MHPAKVVRVDGRCPVGVSTWEGAECNKRCLRIEALGEQGSPGPGPLPLHSPAALAGSLRGWSGHLALGVLRPVFIRKLAGVRVGRGNAGLRTGLGEMEWEGGVCFSLAASLLRGCPPPG